MQDLIIKIESKIAEQNVNDFAAQVKNYLANINTRLETDEDFAQAENDCKELKTIEEKTRAAIKSVLDGSAEAADLIGIAENAAEELRKTRLELEKQVKSEKERVRTAKIAAAKSLLNDFLNKADARINQALRRVIHVENFEAELSEAIKGKRSLDGLDKAINPLTTHWLEKAKQSEDFMLKRLEQIPSDAAHLFPDINELLGISSGFEETVKQRVEAQAQRQAQEQARLEAEAEVKARAKIEAEQTIQATQAETSNSALEQERPAGTWYAEAAEYADVAVTTPQTDAPQDNYKILLTCSLEQAKAIAKHIKETYPAAFTALKKGE